MIARVYESIEKIILQKNKKIVEKERKVKQLIDSWEEKYVDQPPQEGYCGRCNRHYKYGDNPKDPSKCPRCVCVDCKGSIMDRRKIATYGGSIIRCYADWYKHKYGYRYTGHITGWEIDYSHKIPKKLPPVLSKIPIKKEVEVTEKYNEEMEIEESVKITENRLVDKGSIPYNQKNKVIFNDFPNYRQFISDYLNLEKHFKDQDISRYEKWYGSKSHNHVLELLNLRNTTDKIILTSLPPLDFNELIVGEKQMLEEFPSVVGFYPNVPAYIQGHPLNMYNNKRVNKVDIEKSINIYFNIAMDSKCFDSQYKNRGIICFSLIDYLMRENIKVNLKLIDTSFIDGETLVQTIDFDYETMKQDIVTVFNFLTISAVLRIMMLEYKASMVKSGKLNQSWLNGFGNSLDDKNIRHLLNLRENDLVFGTPDELYVSGYDLEDDFVNCMNALEIGYTYDLVYQSNDILEAKETKLFDIKEFIKNRGITKLIHFTSTDNLESIYKNGLLPRNTLLSRNLEFDYNDHNRLDNRLDAICISVSNPNSHLLDEFINRYPEKKYVVLEINPSILYEIKKDNFPIERIYSDYNAASKYAKKSFVDMSIMFKKEINKRHIAHNRDGKKDFEPTSDQAEILFFGKIDTKYITNLENIYKEFKSSNNQALSHLNQSVNSYGSKNNLESNNLESLSIIIKGISKSARLVKTYNHANLKKVEWSSGEIDKALANKMEIFIKIGENFSFKELVGKIVLLSKKGDNRYLFNPDDEVAISIVNIEEYYVKNK